MSPGKLKGSAGQVLRDQSFEIDIHNLAVQNWYPLYFIIVEELLFKMGRLEGKVAIVTGKAPLSITTSPFNSI